VSDIWAALRRGIEPANSGHEPNRHTLTCLSDSVKSLSRPCAYVVTFRASLPDLLFPFLLGQNSRLGGSRPKVVNRSRQDASEVPQKDIYVPGASHRGGGHKVPPPLFHTHFSQRGNGREGGTRCTPPLPPGLPGALIKPLKFIWNKLAALYIRYIV
jgi:hypothetical protein